MRKIPLLLSVLVLAGCGSAFGPSNGSSSAESSSALSSVAVSAGNWQTYQSPSNHYSLSYPPDVTLAPRQPANPPDVEDVRIDLPASIGSGTTLGEAYVEAEVQPAPCNAPLFDSLSSTGSTAINGVTFQRGDGSGVGAGNLYQGSVYTTVRNGSCYRLTGVMHSCNLGPDCGEGRTAPFDKQKVQGMLEGIVGTFRFVP